LSNFSQPQVFSQILKINAGAGTKHGLGRSRSFPGTASFTSFKQVSVRGDRVPLTYGNESSVWSHDHQSKSFSAPRLEYVAFK